MRLATKKTNNPVPRSEVYEKATLEVAWLQKSPLQEQMMFVIP